MLLEEGPQDGVGPGSGCGDERGVSAMTCIETVALDQEPGEPEDDVQLVNQLAIDPGR